MFNRKSLAALIVGMCLFAAAPIAGADVIFGTLNPSLEGWGWESTTAGQQEADDFTLVPGLSTITDFHWWGFVDIAFQGDGVLPNNDFVVRIFEDDGLGGPGSSPLYEWSLTGVSAVDSGTVSFAGTPVYEYAVDVPAVTLNANTAYYFSVLWDGLDPDGDFWVWSALDTVGPSWYRFADGEDWVRGDTDHVFALTNDGVIPEPATLSLLGLGLAGAVIARRRR